jgi:hypothetical protein
VATNTGNIVFGNATADWSTAVAYGITDASTAGNILYTGALAPTLTLKDTYNLTFPTGNITVSIT